MKRKRFQVSFFLRRDRMKEGNAPIYLKISTKKVSTRMSINHYVDPNDWDVRKGCVKYGRPKHDIINDYIDELRLSIMHAQKTLLSDDEDVSPGNIIRVLQGDYNREYTLLEVFRNHNTDMQTRIGHGFSEGSHKNYRLTYRHIEKFLKTQYKVPDISIKRVDHRFLTEFDHFMRVVQGNVPNGSMKNLVRLKKIIRIAMHNDWLTKDPFRNFKITIEQPTRTVLSPQELEQLEKTEITNAKLAKARDIFLFMCYTGLAYVDINNLTGDMISTGIDGNLWIMGERVKSGIRYAVPLLPKARMLMDKYADKGRDMVFPVMSNQKMNDYIKEVAELCNINKKVSCHTARHTFATTVTLLNGVPIETVSRMLGHTDLKTTQIYAKVLDSKVSRDMQAIMEKFSHK